MTEPRKGPKEVKCVPMSEEKLLAIDWGDKRVLRLYYPTGTGSYYYDEIVYDGKVFVARRGKASDVGLEHDYVEWERTYKPTDGAIIYFERAYKEPWWNTFRDAWREVTSLCPVFG